MLPIATVLRSVGLEVNWDSAQSAVLVSTGVQTTFLAPPEVPVTESVPVQPVEPVIPAVPVNLVTRTSDNPSREEAIALAAAFDNGTAVARTAAEIAALPPSQHNSSSFILPNRMLTDAELQMWIVDYWAHGGPSENELEYVRLINYHRVNVRGGGRQALEMCDLLMMAARFQAQQIADLRAQGYSLPMRHGMGPYGSACSLFGVLGGRSRGGRENLFSGTNSTAAFNWWVNSSGHEATQTNINATIVGFGSFPGSISIATFHR